AELLRIFSAERERIGRINAAGDDAHECLILHWLWSWHVLKLEHAGRAIFVRNHGSHHRFLLRADRQRHKNSNCPRCQTTKIQSIESHDPTFARDWKRREPKVYLTV